MNCENDLLTAPLRIETRPGEFTYTGKVLHRRWPDGSLQVGACIQWPEPWPGQWINILADKLREILVKDVEWIPLEMPDGVDPIKIEKYPMARALKVMDAVEGFWVFRVDMRVKEPS